MPDAPTFILGLGAATAVGRNALATAAAIRAGISGISNHPYMIDTAGEPFTIALAPWLDVDMPLRERIAALLLATIDQIMGSPEMDSPDIRTGAAIALPATRPGVPGDLEPHIQRELSRLYGTRLTATAVFAHGHASGLLALDAARRAIAQGTFDACLVAGADSYISADTLEWLEQCDQLHGAGSQNNAWGFVPGEGAGAFLLVGERVAERCGDAVLGQVLGVGTAVESKLIKSDSVCIGEGLTEAFRGALQRLPAGTKVTDVYCDMNGEPYRADEYGFTCLRTKEYFESASEFVAPADCCGDIGAASGPLHVALAAIAGSKAYAKGPLAFVWGSSELGQRAAVAIRTRWVDDAR